MLRPMPLPSNNPLMVCISVTLGWHIEWKSARERWDSKCGKLLPFLHCVTLCHTLCHMWHNVTHCHIVSHISCKSIAWNSYSSIYGEVGLANVANFCLFSTVCFQMCPQIAPAWTYAKSHWLNDWKSDGMRWSSKCALAKIWCRDRMETPNDELIRSKVSQFFRSWNARTFPEL